MIHKMYYTHPKSYNKVRPIQIFKDDIVKVDIRGTTTGEQLFKITWLYDSDTDWYNFHRCRIRDLETHTWGWDSIMSNKLIFVGREFFDPEETMS
jgi:hypothetical protein